MNAREKITEPVQGTSSLVRPRYTPGLLLQDEDLTQAVDYTRDLSRLLFRSFFGCGVICGLKVDAAEKCGKIHITVDPGIALDCLGDPVQIKSVQTITIDPTCGKPPPESMCVVVRRREKSCAPRTAACAGDDDEQSSAATRIVDGFELRVLSECPECGCGCLPCETAEPPAPPAEAPPPPPEIMLIESVAGYQPNADVVGAPLKASADATAASAQAMIKREGRDCGCADPTDPCYADHYAGKCACCCESDWVSLARVFFGTKNGKNEPEWQVDHSVRRFIRPVLVQDPLVDCTRRKGTDCC
jgi:hypothetical protein